MTFAYQDHVWRPHPRLPRDVRIVRVSDGAFECHVSEPSEVLGRGQAIDSAWRAGALALRWRGDALGERMQELMR